MAEVWFDLANQPPQNDGQGGRLYRANVNTVFAEDIGHSLCLNRISDLDTSWSALLRENFSGGFMMENISRTLVPVP